ncbi:hypothetical protein T11_9861 [Trichinella zimbabwensis]|uniref:Uncharacterized protein n=1 Tax=Trichinella zimbabwensis TaxID=268475 RepID=A0A0V1GXW5_9BILA|nr:hypothetical protein T11_9861 [Trichinella zimbabwensis]
MFFADVFLKKLKKVFGCGGNPLAWPSCPLVPHHCPTTWTSGFSVSNTSCLTPPLLVEIQLRYTSVSHSCSHTMNCKIRTPNLTRRSLMVENYHRLGALLSMSHE